MQKDQQLSLRKQAESKLKAKNINSLLPQEKLSHEKIEKIMHELEVHQIELEMQNEELTHTQLQLNIAKDFYFDLYDLAPIGYCMLDGDGLIQEANVSVANLLGVNRQQLIKQPIVQFISREDQDIYYFLKKRLLESGFKQECELRMHNAQGVKICVHLIIVSSQKDSNNNQYFRLILSDISKQKEQEKQLFKAENLVKKELYHRVKNNMQFILALFKLQLAPFMNSDIQQVIKEVTYKIQGMASVHDMLYKQKILTSIDASQYFITLVNALKNGYETEHIKFELKIDAQLSSDQLIFCGLIVNEVVMNAIKYAFNDKEEKGWIIALNIYSDEKQTILEISDNGIGMDETRKISFGTEMIESLIQNELKGKMKLETDKGVRYTFYIPLPSTIV